MPGAPILVVDDSRVNLKGFQLGAGSRRPGACAVAVRRGRCPAATF
jgi:hypothetical protein